MASCMRARTSDPVAVPPGPRAWFRTRIVRQDLLWSFAWLAGMAALWAWTVLFLNRPALEQLQQAILHTLAGALLVAALSLLLAFTTAMGIALFQQRNRPVALTLTFILTLIRSIPQMIGLLVGYILLTIAIEHEVVQSQAMPILWMSVVLSVFLFPELTETIRERIAFYRQSDFYNAMLCSGIKDRRILAVEILWKNSRAHIIQKLVSIFGMAIFLQCSIDFIISVGLSTDVSLSNFPVTLGGLLATLDSKQDILAISMALQHPGYLSNLFFRHLQGISVAFSIVYTLVCAYKISNGIVQRYRL